MKTKGRMDLLVGVFALLVFGALSTGGCAAADALKLMAEYRAMEGEVEFYGQVVDQYGTPVEGAAVTVSIPTPEGLSQCMLMREKTLFTGKDGRFEVSRKTYGLAQLKARYLYLEDIAKEGYEGQRVEWRDRKQTWFCYSTSNTERFVPDPARPVVYAMRKKGQALAFLFGGGRVNFQVPVSRSGKTIRYDFIQSGFIKGDDKPGGKEAIPVCDLQLRATFNPSNATWTVVLSPGTTNGGIIVADQIMYEAPATGYQAEYTYVPKEGQAPTGKYIYVRSRDPAIYTRCEVSRPNANGEFFRLNLTKSVTNPYGDRNLEEADVPYEVRKQLTAEVEAAFRQNKRPERPDLPKLVKEANEKKAKEKAEKDKGKP